VCGNDVVQAGEECDDGNTEPGDLPSPPCSREIPEGCGAITGLDYQNACLLTPFFTAMQERGEHMEHNEGTRTSPRL
jgi:cysteine-rich repeat protein